MRPLDPTDRGRAPEAPLSLSLVAKKKEILQSELSKMEQRLRGRSEVLSRLRSHHEALLNANGQLQQRNCLRKDKLDHLQQSVGLANAAGAAAPRDQMQTTDSGAVSEKCAAMKQLVESLLRKQQLLEQECMSMEDTLAHKTEALQRAKQRLREVSETLQLSAEDVHSVEWAFEEEQIAVRDAENSLRLLGQQLELETLALNQSCDQCRKATTLHQELVKARGNFCLMAKEAHDQLLAAKDEASRDWKDSLSSLGRPGATCSKDEEVHQTQVALATKLEQLTQSIATTKSARRELVFRTKQEREMLLVTKSGIKAKEDQLEWLERQRAFLDCEYQSLVNSRAVSQANRDESVLAFKRTLMSLEEDKCAAKAAIQQIEDEIADANDALAELKRQLSKERKSLGQQVRKRNAKQKQLKSSTATLDFIRADAKSAQQTLETAQAVQQSHQATLDKLAEENEELNAKCAQIQDQNSAAERALSTLTVEIEAEARLADSRMHALADTYLIDPDFSDWHNVIPNISKKVANEKIRKQSEFQQQSAASAAQLRSKYDIMFVALSEKFGKMLREKQATFDTALQKLRSTDASHANTRHGSSLPLEEASAPTRHPNGTATTTVVSRKRGVSDQAESSAPNELARDAASVADPVKSDCAAKSSANLAHAEAAPLSQDGSSRSRNHKPKTSSSQAQLPGHSDSHSMADSTTSASLAVPLVLSSSPARPFASPLPVSSHGTKHNSTRKKLQLREKPRRKPQNSRQPTSSQASSGRTGIAASPPCSSHREPIFGSVRHHEDSEDHSAKPVGVRTPPVLPSSSASLSPRHASAADSHQRLANKEVHMSRGCVTSNDGGEATPCGTTTAQAYLLPSNRPQQQHLNHWTSSSSNEKENDPPPLVADATNATKSTEVDDQAKPKRHQATSFSQAARSGRTKLKSKKVGATIARKKRASLGGRKKPSASAALLSTTISGAGSSSGGIIDATSISSAVAKSGARHPPSLASDWFADDCFSFD